MRKSIRESARHCEVVLIMSASGELPDDFAANVSFRCNLPPFFPPSLGVSDVINKVQATIAILTSLFGLPLNLYLFVIILKYKSLHQRALFLSLQIIAVEVVYHAVVPVTILTSGITGTWVFGEVFCNFTGIIHDAFAMFRFSMMFVLTMDRFIYIFGPFLYSKHGGKISWTLSSVMWSISLVRVIVPLYGILDCYTYIPTFKTCTVFSGCSKPCEYFAAASIGFIVITGVILPLLLYIIIFIKVKQITGQHTAITKNYLNNVKLNTQRAFVRLQHRKKILITVFLLLVSIIGGTTPAFTLYIVTLFYRVSNTTLFTINMLVGRTFFNLIPIFDAIAFTRHADVQTTSKRVLQSLNKTSTSL